MLPRPLSTTLILDFGIVPTVWIFFLFSFYSISRFPGEFEMRNLIYFCFANKQSSSLCTPTKVKHHPIFLSIYFFTSILLKQ